ncbi:hypothetical protein IB211_01740 [Intestinimonas butyriciproducens]|uniref:Uncharacterized protein n=1 Tax=Intestinimonas butyriciproducens TaxID=1297617 RepID=A0A0S2W4A2_9FIRM|nr:hypothetical protein IB211_01740 [Intestinimonas butyriciproducens]
MAVADGQRLFRTPGHHPQERRNPHPEDSPRSPVKNRGGHTCDAARTNGGGKRRRQGLKLGDPFRLPPALRVQKRPYRSAHPEPELKKLEESAAYGVIEPQQQEGTQKPWIPDPITQALQKRHVRIPPRTRGMRTVPKRCA